MKNSQKGSVLVIVTVVVLLLIMGGLFLITSSGLQQAREENVPFNKNTQVQSDKTTEQLAVPFGWKKYSNQELGVSFVYPVDWTVRLDQNSTITISAPQKNVQGKDGNMIFNSFWKIMGDKEGQELMNASLKKDIERRSNFSVSGIKALIDVKSDSANTYRTNISFVVNNKYYLINENWVVAGVLDNILTNTRVEAIKTLKQITSSLIIK